MTSPIFKKTYNRDMYNTSVDTVESRIENHKSNIKKYYNDLYESQQRIKKAIASEREDLAKYKKIKVALKNIIKINDAVNINNTQFDKLPYEIYRSITDRNLFQSIKDFDRRTLKGGHYYRSNCKDYSLLGYRNYDLDKRFVPAVKFGIVNTHYSKTRRGIFIHGEEYGYTKGVLINYLKDNGVIAYKSWTFKKLYEACYSF